MPSLTRSEYERYVYLEVPRHPGVEQSTLHLYMNSAFTGIVRGALFCPMV